MTIARNDPDRALVLRIATEEARGSGVDLSDLLGEDGDRETRAARGKAMRRIVRATACTASGLARVWGCDPQTVWAYAAEELNPGPFPYDERTAERIRWAHPEAVARVILGGANVQTRRDLAAWRGLGSRERAA